MDYLKRKAKELREFAAKTGVRRDWHEPDEQDVKAVVTGTHLDNAFGESQDRLAPFWQEFVVHLRGWDRKAEDFITYDVNLATLLAIATEGD